MKKIFPSGKERGWLPYPVPALDKHVGRSAFINKIHILELEWLEEPWHLVIQVFLAEDLGYFLKCSLLFGCVIH